MSGASRPGLAFVSFFGQSANARFDPQTLTVLVRSRELRPIGIVPFSGRFTSQQLNVREQVSAIYLFAEDLPVNDTFTISYGGQTSDDWQDKQTTLDRERARVALRSRDSARRLGGAAGGGAGHGDRQALSRPPIPAPPIPIRRGRQRCVSSRDVFNSVLPLHSHWHWCQLRAPHIIGQRTRYRPLQFDPPARLLDGLSAPPIGRPAPGLRTGVRRLARAARGPPRRGRRRLESHHP